MSKKSILKEPEMIMAICAVFLSLVAVSVALFEANIAREQQKVSAWPYLDVTSSNLNGMTHMVINKGLGPAIIKDVRVSFRNTPVKEWGDLFNLIDEQYPWATTTSTLRNQIISPGQTFNFLKLNKDIFKEYLKTSKRHDISVSICYCSVYQDCWLAETETPVFVESCKTDKKYSFQG